MRSGRIAAVGCVLLSAGCGSLGISSAHPQNIASAWASTPGSKYAVLHSFGASGDGVQPEDKLIAVGTKLYGTTYGGGNYGSGTVFEIEPSGSEKTIYSFGGTGDGANPYGSLLNLGGTLYGTTANGGANGVGTVFSLGAAGKEMVI